jgi:hypothetical protein
MNAIKMCRGEPKRIIKFDRLELAPDVHVGTTSMVSTKGVTDTIAAHPFVILSGAVIGLAGGFFLGPSALTLLAGGALGIGAGYLAANTMSATTTPTA